MHPRHVPFLVFVLLAACGEVGQKDGGCPEGTEPCGDECIDTGTDPRHCGACGSQCQLAANSTPGCVDGDCVLECHEGWHDLDGDYLTGCEYECDYQGEIDACNGIDDDCDGTVDNFDVDTCPQGEEVPCTTTCGTTGTGTCTDGCRPPEPEDCTPPDETCNGIDDDCDTVADQAFDCAAGAEVPCTTTCGTTGTGTCLDTCQIPPPGACIPPAETCNGIDDDCVSGPDDSFDCVQGEAVACISECGTTGTGTCTGTCTIPEPADCTPPDETCNWVDDDCDGDIDEGLWGEQLTDVEVAGATSNAAHGTVEYGGGNYLLAWSEDPYGGTDYSVFLRPMGLDGESPSGGGAVVGPNTNIVGDIAWSGSEFLVGFSDDRFADPDVWALRADAMGNALSVEANISTALNGVESIRTEWTGSHWAVAWLDMRLGNRLYYARSQSVSLTPDIEDHITSGLGFLYGKFDVAWTGSSLGVCWGDDRDGAYQLYFKVVGDTGLDLVADAPLTDDFDDVNSCTLAWTGSQFAVGWVGNKAGGGRAAYLMLVDPSGSAVGSEVYLDSVSNLDSAFPVWVEEAGGLGLGVVWSRYSGGSSQIVARRFDHDLETVDGARIVVSGGTDDHVSPSMAWDGSGFGIVWHRRNSASDFDVLFSRVGCPLP